MDGEQLATVDPKGVLAISYEDLVERAWADHDRYRGSLASLVYHAAMGRALQLEPGLEVLTRRPNFLSGAAVAAHEREIEALPDRDRLQRLLGLLNARLEVFWERAEREELAAKDARAMVQRVDALETPLSHADRELLKQPNLRPTPALHAVRDWDRQHDNDPANAAPILLIAGDPGIGKTFAAGGWWLTRSCQSPSTKPFGRYVRFGDLVHERRASYGQPSAEYRALLRVERLVVDEFGTEPTLEDALATLADLFEARNVAGLRTIFVSNGTPRWFASRYGEHPRLASRIRSRVQPELIRGPSLRSDRDGW